MARVTLVESRDDQGIRSLWAETDDEGELTVLGQDLGPGVSAFFGPGNTEYEFAFTVARGDVGSLCRVLGEGTDVLSMLEHEFRSGRMRSSSQLQQLLNEHEIPFEFWSRVG